MSESTPFSLNNSRISISSLLNPILEPPFCISESSKVAYQVQENIPLNRTTVLQKLFLYEAGKVIQYPETSLSAKENIGHLFSWPSAEQVYNVRKDFAYSLGSPCGQRSGRQSSHSNRPSWRPSSLYQNLSHM